jgi:hypothetical protein
METKTHRQEKAKGEAAVRGTLLLLEVDIFAS